MGGQVLGGGVIVLVAALLWLVYLLPSWNSRRQYDAAERNAVRLNQALRVLAETSETPEEVRLELNARTALAQQKLARRALAEREQTALEQNKIELEQAKIELERARDERVAALSAPDVRRARARRRLRLALTVLGIIAVAAAVWGAVQVVATGSQVLLWTGVGVAVLSGLLLQRMSRVGARTVVRVADAPAARVATVQDLALGAPRTWAPRELPKPLTASAGSRAAAMLDAEAAREALRHAAVEESMRQRAEAQRPPSIEFARAGAVDDSAIEAHVRELLARRAVGQ